MTATNQVLSDIASNNALCKAKKKAHEKLYFLNNYRFIGIKNVRVWVPFFLTGL
jgi:hypothetical protein